MGIFQKPYAPSSIFVTIPCNRSTAVNSPVPFQDTVLSAFTPLNIMGVSWALIAEIDIQEAYEDVYQLELFVFLIALATVVVVGMIAWFLSNSISRPLIKPICFL